MPVGAIERDLLCCLLLVPGAVGEDEVVCWWGWVAPCDIHAGGCQLGEVQLGDGPNTWKMERRDAAPAVCRSSPPRFPQGLYGKYLKEVAKLKIWALH